MESSAVNKNRLDHSEFVGKGESVAGVHFKLSPKVTIMLPVVRSLRLICENHNFELQDISAFITLKINKIPIFTLQNFFFLK
jgi:hypothetical protein